MSSPPRRVDPVLSTSLEYEEYLREKLRRAKEGILNSYNNSNDGIGGRKIYTGISVDDIARTSKTRPLARIDESYEKEIYQDVPIKHSWRIHTKNYDRDGSRSPNKSLRYSSKDREIPKYRDSIVESLQKRDVADNVCMSPKSIKSPTRLNRSDDDGPPRDYRDERRRDDGPPRDYRDERRRDDGPPRDYRDERRREYENTIEKRQIKNTLKRYFANWSKLKRAKHAELLFQGRLQSKYFNTWLCTKKSIDSSLRSASIHYDAYQMHHAMYKLFVHRKNEKNKASHRAMCQQARKHYHYSMYRKIFLGWKYVSRTGKTEKMVSHEHDYRVERIKHLINTIKTQKSHSTNINSITQVAYSLTHLLTHSLTYSLTYLLTYSLTHSLTHSAATE